MRQLKYSAPRQKRAQMARAEELYWDIEPERNYPLEWVVYRLTEYRPVDVDESVTLVGGAIRDDLLAMVERVSRSLGDRVDVYDPAALDIGEVCARLGVSSKTVSRYRKRGLFARWLKFGDERMKLGFFDDSIDRFVAESGDLVLVGGKFSRIDEATRRVIVERARRIAGRVDVSVFAVARYLGKKYGRSTETVRMMLLRYDNEHRDEAVFEYHKLPLTMKQKRVIYRAYHWGVPVPKLAARFTRSRDAIYRVVNQRRASALRQLRIKYVEGSTFGLADAEQVILGGEIDGSEIDGGEIDGSVDDELSEGGGRGLPEYLSRLMIRRVLNHETEQRLFVRYNYLKYRVCQMRGELDRHRPRAGALDRIETYLRKAALLKRRLVQCYMPIVVSVARKHALGEVGGWGDGELLDLIGEGNILLVNSIETFDVSGDARFGSYLTWVIMRHFAADITRRRKTLVKLSRADELIGEYWPGALNPNLAALAEAENVRRMLMGLLDELDERERLVVTRHFGLELSDDDESGGPRALVEVAEELGLGVEHARKIERIAMKKLRVVVERMGIDLRSVGLPDLS